MIFLQWWKLLIGLPCLLFRQTNAFSSTTIAPTTKFAESRQPNTRLYGVLSRSAIMKNIQGSNNNKRPANAIDKGSKKPASSQPISQSFLMEAMDEAMLRQELILEALDNERTKYANRPPSTTNEEPQSFLESGQESNQDKRTVAQKMDSINQRRGQIINKMNDIHTLKEQIKHGQRDLTMEDLKSFKQQFELLGFASILRHNPKTWKIRSKSKEYGLPDGFDGLVFYTPRGVPILVGRPKVHKDETLRRVAQGADLWFQVEDYAGSRVLLRSSLQRGLKDSKECRQMAANLAARYSDWYYYHSDKKDVDRTRIPIMYCDSRKVATRGSRVGRMKHRKKLGRMYGDLTAVEELTRDKEMPPSRKDERAPKKALCN